MTDSLFFDTDCLSAFLWVGNESLLPQMYPGKVVIPGPVYEELCNPGIPHLKARVDQLLSQGLVSVQNIDLESEEYATFYQLTEFPAEGHKMIGKGEAASISLAKAYDGIVASNNLRDIAVYITEYNLQHKTTGDILTEAYHKGLITEDDGNMIWASMLAKRRKLGAATFSEYLQQHV